MEITLNTDDVSRFYIEYTDGSIWRLDKTGKSGPLLLCEVCGDPFGRTSSKGPTPKYCSDGCRQKAWRDRNPDDDRLDRAIRDHNEDTFVAYHGNPDHPIPPQLQVGDTLNNLEIDSERLEIARQCDTIGGFLASIEDPVDNFTEDLPPDPGAPSWPAKRRPL